MTRLAPTAALCWCLSSLSGTSHAFSIVTPAIRSTSSTQLMDALTQVAVVQTTSTFLNNQNKEGQEDIVTARGYYQPELVDPFASMVSDHAFIAMTPHHAHAHQSSRSTTTTTVIAQEHQWEHQASQAQDQLQKVLEHNPKGTTGHYWEPNPTPLSSECGIGIEMF
eukprot:CAMPEP_0172439614 /NCGR_PEP_ID=MMETSP1065-20121228/539_1 /TAXON_ID=265537 /ORGANISM="Amphiprora paludosa, Strain CCMP125" /LENGTH=165 /DNA_ID=CAMNT_0013188321 /DNA_START=64 /DNA_END=561 /DNA_ORIENTATION=+